MKPFLLGLALVLPLTANSAVQREINGVNYYLAYEFDTADGECILQGHQYASSFYSISSVAAPVAYLNPDGTVNHLVTDANSPTAEVIEEVTCE